MGSEICIRDSVSVSRPHHLDLENTPVSESIRDIVSFIIDTENCTRRNVLEKFAPEPEAPEASEEGDEKKDAPLSPERTALLSDLHWLVHQGHVIEYANGQMEVAPKPQPPQQKKKKPKPEKKEEAPAAEEAKAETTPAEPATEPAKGGGQALGQAESTEPSEPAPELETAEAEPAKEEAPAPAAE